MDLIIDTETSGLSKHSFATLQNYRQWPRLVQLAWILANEQSETIQKCEIIRPEGYEIPLNATQIHGISHQQAHDRGRPIREVFKEFQPDLAKARNIVAHNLTFDLGVLQSEAYRHDFQLDWPGNHYCTVHMGKKYLHEVKGYRRGGFLKLIDLYQTLFGISYGPQHEALSDARACYQIYRYLKRHIISS